jgi:hypothetical protein
MIPGDGKSGTSRTAAFSDSRKVATGRESVAATWALPGSDCEDGGGIMRSADHAKEVAYGCVDRGGMQLLHRRHIGPRGTAADGADELSLRVGRAIDCNFDGAIWAVPHPSGEAQPICGLPYVPSKANALHAPADAKEKRRHASNLALHPQECGQGCRDCRS